MADGEPRFEISDHAAEAIRERGIDPAWIARVLAGPARTEPDRLDPAAMHAMAAIPECGGRVLRVIYNGNVSPCRIITAYFDRRMEGRL
jgi:hypothetical protein